MTDDKARKVAEELTTAWFNLTDPDQMDDWLEDHITAALLQFAQAQESEAVRELVAGLKPFSEKLKRFDKNESNLIAPPSAYKVLAVDIEHFRKAAALIAKHSRKGPTHE